MDMDVLKNLRCEHIVALRHARRDIPTKNRKRKLYQEKHEKCIIMKMTTIYTKFS